MKREPEAFRSRSPVLPTKADTSLGQWFDEIVPFNDIPEGQAVIKGYFDETVTLEAIRDEITPRVNELKEFGIDTGEVRYEMKTVDENDWATAWKQYFKPIRVSDRLTIKPTWEEYTPESEHESIIELDPGWPSAQERIQRLRYACVHWRW